MNRSLSFIILSIFLVFVLSYSLSWMLGLLSIAGLALAFKVAPWQGALFGFIAVFIVWSGFAYFLSTNNDHLLANQVGDLLGGISGMMLTLVPGMLGGIAGALIALLTALVFRPKHVITNNANL